MSVYTSLTRADLLDFLHHYDVGQLQDFNGIKEGVENTNYLLQTARGRYVLTLFEQLEANQVLYFLQLKQWLHQQGLPVALPVSTQAGELCLTLKGKPAALIQFQPGKSVFHVNEQQAFSVGTCLAQLHLACRDYPAPPASNQRQAKWMKNSFHALSTRLRGDQRELIHTELEYLRTHWAADLPCGLIHGDLFRDNCLMLGNEVSTVLDWYAASHDAWLFDLAIGVNDWCSDGEGELDPALQQAMLTGYQSVRNLSHAEQQAWEWAQRRAALRFYLSRLAEIHDPQEGELTHIKDPEEFGRLLLNLREQVATL